MMSQEQFEEINQERRQALNHGSRIAMAASVLGALGIASTANAKQASAEKSPYAEPEQYGLKRHGMTIDPKRVALVVVDPQIDFLGPKGVMWGVLGDSIKENNTVANIESLFKAAKAVDMPTFVRHTTITRLITNGNLVHRVNTLCTTAECLREKVNTPWKALKIQVQTLCLSTNHTFLMAKQ